MAERPERVLAIDADSEIVRGLVLASGSPTIAGGYAQLGFDPAQGPAVFAARIAAALDVKTVLPVVVTCADALGTGACDEVAAAISEIGFTSVSIVNRADAARRANPTGGIPETLVDVDIPSGLLTSHVGLTLTHLAPAVGAGLGILGGGHDPVVAADDDGIAVWSPDTDAPPAPATDPFTGEPLTDAEISAPAAVVGVTSNLDADDDLTVAAPATMPAITDAAAVEAETELAEEETELAEADTELAEADTELPRGDAGLPYDDTTRLATALPGETEDDAVAPGQGATAAAMASPASIAAGASSDGEVRAADPEHPATPTSPSVALVPWTGDGSEEPGRSKRPLLLLLLGAIIIVAIAALAISQCGSSVDTDDVVSQPAATPQPSEPTAIPAVEPTAEPEPEPAATAEPTAEPAPEPTATAEPEPTATAEPAPEPTPDPLEGLPPLSSLPERGAIFRPPTLFLEGPVQTQEQADQLYQRAIEVVGPDNVVNNYVVRPDAPPALDGNVRVEQAVLFETGSAVISDQFIPTLELGVAVMALNPQVQMVVEGHTDSVGSDETNLVLSQRRAQAVVDYLISRGVDGSRLTPVGLGESTPVASNETAAGQQINRRIEVELLDLLAVE